MRSKTTAAAPERTGNRPAALPLQVRLAIVAFAAALFATLTWALAAMPFDDAFIHGRVARNLVNGHGPFFNPGQQIFGDSSPLWVLLVATTFRIAGQSEMRLISVVSTAGLLLAFLATESILATLQQRRSLATHALALAMVLLLLAGTAGFLMETPLALALATAGLAAMLQNRPALAGVFTALATATRYEMVIAVVLLFLVAQGRRERLRYVAGVAVPALLEVAWLLSTYGRLVPNTIAAKAIVFDVDRAFVAQNLPGGFLGVAVALALGALVVGLAWRSVRQGQPSKALRGAFVLLSFAAVLVAVFLARRVIVFPWYPVLVAFPVALGAMCLALLDDGTLRRRWRWVAFAAAATCFVPPAFTSAQDLLAVARGRPGDSFVPSLNLRTRAYLQMGEKLASKCPDARLMTAEIGAIGWAFPGPIVDAGALVSPELMRYHPLPIPAERSHGAWGLIPAKAVIDLTPELVVSMEVFAANLYQHRADPGVKRYKNFETLPLYSEGLVRDGVAPVLWDSRFVIAWARDGSCRRE